MHYIILIFIVAVQIGLLLLIIQTGNRIRYLFPDRSKRVLVKRDAINGLSIDIQSDVQDMQTLKSEVNDYLRAHHDNEKLPDIAQLITMTKDRSRIYDGKAGALVTVPILVGLAGTVIGLGWAFLNIGANQEDAEMKFLSVITRSSSIAFIGTLVGILVTIGSAMIISSCKRERDMRLNWFCTNLNTYLAVGIPTIKEQTVSLIASSMNKFSEEYFGQFAQYTKQFKEINIELTALFNSELKETIKQNTASLQKVSEYIVRLDKLYEVTRGITFKPTMVSEFSAAAGSLVQSLQSATSNHQEYTTYLSNILEAYKNLETRVSGNLIDLVKQKAVFGNFEGAVQKFITDGSKWMEDFSKVSEDYTSKIDTLSTTYTHTVGTIKDKLMLQVENNFNSEGYKDFAKQILALQESIEKELSNIKDLGSSLNNLADAVSTYLVPSIKDTSKSLAETNETLKTVLPNAIEESVEKHRDTIIETSERLLNNPRSWGPWSFKIVTYLIPKRFKRNGRRTPK